MSKHDTVLRLVSEIYDAAVESSLWPVFLEDVAETLGAHSVAFSILGRPGSQVSLDHIARYDPSAQALYLKYYSRVDPWVRVGHQRGLLRVGVCDLAANVLPHTDLQRTEFWNDFGRRFDLRGGMAAILAVRAPGVAGFGMHERKGSPFGQEDLALVKLLIPHLQRAQQIHLRLSEVTESEMARAAVLDRLSTGVIMLSASLEVLWLNREAQRILELRDGLALDKHELRAAGRKDLAALRALLRDALETSHGSGLGAGGVVSLGRPSGKRPWQALVVPLRIPPDPSGTDCSRVVVFVVDPNRTTEMGAERFRQLYDLTPAESRLANALLGNLQIEQAASAFGISIHTARSQLKALLRKTDTRRQSELVQLLGRLAGSVSEP